MNDFPEDHDENIYPSSFDADAFLTDALSDQIDFDVDEQRMQIQQRAVEENVLNALHEAGFPTEPIRAMQTKLLPDQTLSDVVELFSFIGDDDITEESKNIVSNAINYSIIISGIAISKIMAEECGAEDLSSTKKEQQAGIYADNTLSPDVKLQFLAALDKIYPGVEGLDPNSPDTVSSIEDFDKEEKERTEITEKSIPLRGFATAKLSEAMTEVGIGQHHELNSVANNIVVTLTRLHVVETGNYDESNTETWLDVARTSLMLIRNKVQEMGWTDEQYEYVIQQVREAIQSAESE